MKQLNILFLNKFREIGGSEVFLFELIRNLNPEKFRSVIALIGESTPTTRSVVRDVGVPVYDDLFRTHVEANSSKDNRGLRKLVASWISPQGRSSPYDLTAVLRLAKILRKENIDILFYVDKHAALYLAPMAALLARTPIVVGSFHTSELLLSLPQRMLLPITDAFIATSQIHRQYLVETLKIPAGKVEVVYNGVSQARFEGIDKTVRENKREELNIPKDAPVVGVMVRLVPEKNIRLMLHTAAQLMNTLPAVHFLIVGDGPERAGLEQLAEELGITKNIHFLGFRKDIGELITVCDVSALSSDKEYLPYTLLESMLLGLPVVSTNVGGIVEMVEHGKNGLLIPPRNQEALHEALATLLQQPDLARQMGADGQKRVLEKFSSKAMALQIEDIVDKVAAEKKVAVRGRSEEPVA